MNKNYIGVEHYLGSPYYIYIIILFILYLYFKYWNTFRL